MGFVPVGEEVIGNILISKNQKMSLLLLKPNYKSQQELHRESSTLNKKLKPIIRYEGGRKFFFPEKQRQNIRGGLTAMLHDVFSKFSFIRGFRLP